MKANPLTSPLKLRLLSGLALLVFSATVLTHNTATASIAGARASARALLITLVDRLGLSVRDQYDQGLLQRGDFIVVETYLNAGNHYFLVAGGCEDAYDVDIDLFDENGGLIASDPDASSVAVAEVSPRWSGKFYVRITMYDSTPNGAHWVLQTAYVNE